MAVLKRLHLADPIILFICTFTVDAPDNVWFHDFFT
jgi:hypothetical protein